MFALLFIGIIQLESSNNDSTHTKMRQPGKSGEISTPAKIIQAYKDQKISLDEEITYLCYYLFDFSRLPQEFQNHTAVKCGTWIIDIIKQNWSDLQPDTRKKLSEYGINGF